MYKDFYETSILRKLKKKEVTSKVIKNISDISIYNILITYE